MKKNLIILTLIFVSFLTVFSDSSNFYWYRTSEGASTKVGVFRPVDSGVILVAAGASGIFTSRDGITWTERTFEGYNEWHHRAVSGNSDGFVVGGDYSVAGLVTSENGISWQSHQLEGSSIHDIVWSEEKKLYVAVGEWGQSMIRWSTDGTNWNHMDVTSGQTLNGVAYGNGEFLAVGEWGDGGIYGSNDGSTWIKGNNNYGNNFHSIEYGQDKFVAVGEGIIAYKSNSSDTFNKNVSGFNTFHTLNDVIWNGSIFVSVGDAKYVNGKTQAIVYTSSDGVNWTRQDTNINTDLKSITYSEELSAFFAVGDGLVLTSTDGNTWSQVNAVDQQGNSLVLNLESIFSPIEQAETQTPEWIILTKEGYKCNGNFIINGHIAVWETLEMVKVGQGNAGNINGDIIIKTLTDDYTLEQIDAHNNGDAYVSDFKLPDCFCSCSNDGYIENTEQYPNIGHGNSQRIFNTGISLPNALQINISSQVEISNGGIYSDSSSEIWNDLTINISSNLEIEGDICVLHFDYVKISGNCTIMGNICAPNAKRVEISGNPEIYGGICAPNAEVVISGNPNVSNKIYVKKLIISGNPVIGFMESGNNNGNGNSNNNSGQHGNPH